jgi:carbonic anhydrase/acetyltransferase-like protein (isoleucine patch superfamily)
LIGMGAIVRGGASIGEYALMGAGSIVTVSPQRRISEVQRMDNMKVAYETMLGLAAEMVLDEALRKHRTEKIYKAIDDALAQGDSEKFKLLTDELKTFGS